MTSQSDLAIIRRAYAKHVAATAQIRDPRFVEALAEVRREDFVPPGPWPIWRGGAHDATTPDADPLYLYQDVVVPLLPEKGLNNGQPSFVTMLIGLCEIREGDSVVHIGAGTGYYTALLARLAGGSGRVLGVEIEAELAKWAKERLALQANTRIIEADGWTTPLEPADVILVNAGTPRFAQTWLDALKPAGRLVVPLATRSKDGDRTTTRGIVFRIVRDADGFAAAAKSGTTIYPCAGACEPDAEAALAAALKAGGAAKVTRLRRGDSRSAEKCWLRGQGWCLLME